MWYSSGTPNDGVKFQRKMNAAARQSGPERAPSRRAASVAFTVARSTRVRGSCTAQAEAANESAGKSATKRKVRL